jgi:hypothetical protein
LKAVEEGRVGLYFLGERRVIAASMAEDAVVVGTSTVIVLPGVSFGGSVSAILGYSIASVRFRHFNRGRGSLTSWTKNFDGSQKRILD